MSQFMNSQSVSHSLSKVGIELLGQLNTNTKKNTNKTRLPTYRTVLSSSIKATTLILILIFKIACCQSCFYLTFLAVSQDLPMLGKFLLLRTPARSSQNIEKVPRCLFRMFAVIKFGKFC